MDSELELLHDVVRALVAERRAGDTWSAAMNALRAAGGERTPDCIREMRRLFSIAFEGKKATDQALARLAEVNPELVDGGAAL